MPGELGRWAMWHPSTLTDIEGVRIATYLCGCSQAFVPGKVTSVWVEA